MLHVWGENNMVMNPQVQQNLGNFNGGVGISFSRRTAA
jgi:hypothetical protein